VGFGNSFKLGIYSRNATNGALTGISNLRDGYRLTKMTSNGAYLYAFLNNLIIYSRNISTGALTLVAEDFQATTNAGFLYKTSVEITSDNRSLYIADFSQTNFYSYLIDPATGLVTLSQTISLSSISAEMRPIGVVSSNDGKFVYVTVYDVNQVNATTMIMYSRSLTAPYTLTQVNTYVTAVGEQSAGIILTKSQNLILVNLGSIIRSYSRNVVTGNLTINPDITGAAPFGQSGILGGNN
jgi:6-phosphogluconolactonase (cycloisomerase 2 family)